MISRTDHCQSGELAALGDCVPDLVPRLPWLPDEDPSSLPLDLVEELLSVASNLRASPRLHDGLHFLPVFAEDLQP